MIVKEVVKVAGKSFVHTYSDKGCQIERDGCIYDDAYDPVNSDRMYIETDMPITTQYE